MESVALAFCESVVRLLSFQDFSNDEPLSSAAWQYMIDEELTARINVKCKIVYKNGDWSYSIAKDGATLAIDEITFEKLQNIDRQHLRIVKVEIGSLSYRQLHEASFDEITKLVEFAALFTSMTELNVVNTNDYPRNNLLAVLSLLCNSSIRVMCSRYNSEETLIALSAHLKSNSLRSLTFWHQKFPAEVRTAVTEYLLHNRHFQYFKSECADPLDMDMFTFLFNKPKTVPMWNLECFSSIDLEELKGFERRLQVPSGYGMVKWERPDGLVVEAKQFISSFTRSCVQFG